MPMNEFPLTPLQPDEALYAFLDGELEQHHEQPLFDELAAQPELRTEMKDLLAIRNAVHRDAVFPPPQTDMGLAPIPLAAAAGVASSTSSAWPAVISGIGGVIVGAVAVAVLMSGGNQPPSVAANGIAGQTAPAPERVVVIDTVVVTRRVTAPQMPTATPPPPATDVVASEPSTDASAPAPAIDAEQAVIASVQPLSAVTRIASASEQTFQTASTIAQPAAPLPVRLGFRSLASGLSTNEAQPNSVQSALLPNTAFSLTIPLADDHRFGIEMGSESFRQAFSGFDGYRTAEWLQTPVLFWLGATYIFEPMSLEVLPGLRPFGNASVGTVFAQGPIARGTVGLAYQPIGPIRFTVGVDAAALMYSFQGSWFTSTKLGLSYGLTIDMGGWK